MIVKGKAGIEAEVLLKSEGTHSFISTLRIRFPRFVAEQFLKHRMFSCNAVSSRALSVPKMNQWILNNTSEPIFWGAQKKGMQPDQEHNQLLRDADDYNSYIDLDGSTPEEAWYCARNYTMSLAKAYWEAGYHQQIPNRLTHPFQMAEYIVTATDFDNFFNLRLHDKAAQSEITELAKCMKEAIDKAPVMELIKGWHIPYLTEDDLNCLTLPEMLRVSAARCAIISYNNHSTEDLLSVEKATKIYNHLINDTNPHLCYDRETEVFTTEGWVKFTELTTEHKVAQVTNYEKDGEANLEFVSPLMVQSYDYQGEMYHFNSSHVDLKVSVDHRMLVKNRDKKGLKEGWEILPAQSMATKDFAVRTCASLPMSGTYQEYWEGFYQGFILGDGSQASLNRVSVRLKKPRKIDSFIACLTNTCKTFTYKTDPYGVTEFYVEDNQGLPKAKEKRLPSNLQGRNLSYLKGLFNGLMESDGSIKRKTYSFSSTSEKLIEDLGILCTLIGLRMSNVKIHIPKEINHSISYRVGIHTNKQQHVKASRGEVTVKPEKCKIYCCTVPSGMLLVRRNGKQAVCGNTPMEHQARILSREELDIYWAVTGATMSITGSANKKPHMRDFDTSYFGNLKMWKSQRYLLETMDL